MGLSRATKRSIVVSSDEEYGEDAVGDLIFNDEGADNDKQDTQTTTKNKVIGSTVNKSAKAVLSPKSKKTKKPTKSEVKTSKPEPKVGKGTIFSFFNNATQRQRAAESSSSQSKIHSVPRVEQVEDEDIIDGDDESVTVAQGSQVALAHRKRKLMQTDYAPASKLTGITVGTNKFRKIEEGVRVPVRVEDKRPWTEQYGPNDLSELAVHNKKVKDVRFLLEEATSVRGRPRLIVLKGSAGTGKTTTISLLAEDLGLKVLEWKNALGGGDVGPDSFVSAASQFEDFVLRSSRFSGLDFMSGSKSSAPATVKEESKSPMPTDDQAKIMLIEEFPNTFTKTSTALQSFRSTVQQYLSLQKKPGQRMSPIVMIISETLVSTSTASADSFTAHRLLGPSILSHPLTAEVDFNSVAPTILIKALEMIVVKEARKSGRRKTPGPLVLKQLAETGDIRSAVSSLEFLCVRGDEGDSWSAKVAFTKPKRKLAETPMTTQEQDALKLISNRESTVGIFHAVGKVVYNKRLTAKQVSTQPPDHLSQHRRLQEPETAVDALLIELGTDTSTFTAALHENYALSCSATSSQNTADTLSNCIDVLSDSDMLAPDRFSVGTRSFSGSAQDNIRQDDMSFQMAVRGLLFNLPSPVTRATPDTGRKADAHRMFYPTSLKIWKRKEEIESTLDLVLSSLQSSAASFETSEDHRPPSGVESWTRNAEPVEQAREHQDQSSSSKDISADQSPPPSLLPSAHTETFLLERLPYLHLINRAARGTLAIPTSLREKIADVVSIKGHAQQPDEDEGDDPLGGKTGIEPVDEPSLPGQKRKKGGIRVEKSAGGREANWLEKETGLPVEHAVAGLVIADDDIVDD